MTSKRVLIALHRYSVGGAETQALQLGKALKSKGYIVFVGAFGSEFGEGFERFKREGLDCIHWGFSEKLILYPDEGILGYCRKVRYLSKLVKQVRNIQLDIILPFTYPCNKIFNLYKDRFKVEAIYWNQREEGRFFTGSKTDLFALRQAHTLISNSKEGEQFLKKNTDKEVILISNGIDLRCYIKANNNSFNVVMIGNLHGFKDHLTLIRAWSKINSDYPNHKLILAGSKGSSFEICKEEVEKLGLSNSVKFPGSIKNIPLLLSQCCLAVFSSENEGLPNGVLEPMAAEMPVIASNILGCKEALGEEYEYLVEPGDVEGFAKKISFLLSNEPVRIEIGKNNRLRVEQLFALETMVNHYEHLFEG